jgi:hypothetical protein
MLSCLNSLLSLFLNEGQRPSRQPAPEMIRNVIDVIMRARLPTGKV